MISTPGEASEPLSLRHHLRRATGALHERVDAYFGQFLQQEDGGYERFLSSSASAILPLEGALNAVNVSMVLPDWDQRSRSAALMLDLEELSILTPTANGASTPVLPADEAYLFGVLYVLEGSRLGARVILRELQEAKRDVPTRYLSHGEGKPLWQSFVKHLEASKASVINPEGVVAGAHAAFGMFLPAGTLKGQ
jgi:heme oxygenase (biliverdin-IX-beta and delta-forming)